MSKLLIVDDERKIRQIYKTMLIEEGYEVFEASDAKEATDILMIENLDLVLLDLHMPHIGGSEMMEMMEVYDIHFKVIVISVYPLDKQKKLVPKADDYFDKSDDLNILLQKIKEILKKTSYGRDFDY